MKIGHTIDSNGFWTGDVIDGSEITPDVIVICPDGFNKPHWNGTQWGEGLTQQEIDAIQNAPTVPSPQQQISDLQDMINLIISGGL